MFLSVNNNASSDYVAVVDGRRGFVDKFIRAETYTHIRLQFHAHTYIHTLVCIHVVYRQWS